MNLINKSRRRHLLSSSCHLMRRRIHQRVVGREDTRHRDHLAERSISDVPCRPKQAEASLISVVAARWVSMEIVDLVRIALHWPLHLMETLKAPHSPARGRRLEEITQLHPLRRIRHDMKLCPSIRTLPKQIRPRFSKWLALMANQAPVEEMV